MAFAGKRRRDEVKRGDGDAGEELFVRAGRVVRTGAPLGGLPAGLLDGGAHAPPHLRHFHQASLSANEVSIPSRLSAARSDSFSSAFR